MFRPLGGSTVKAHQTEKRTTASLTGKICIERNTLRNRWKWPEHATKKPISGSQQKIYRSHRTEKQKNVPAAQNCVFVYFSFSILLLDLNSDHHYLLLVIRSHTLTYWICFKGTAAFMSFFNSQVPDLSSAASDQKKQWKENGTSISSSTVSILCACHSSAEFLLYNHSWVNVCV